MFNKNKLWCWIMVFLVALQATAQLLEYIIVDTSNSPFLKVWISFGSSISQNWLAFSITLVLITLGCIIYNKLDNKPYKLSDDISREIILIINLILCNKIYSSTSCIEKLNYFKSHYSVVIALVLIVLSSLAFSIIIKGQKKISEELGTITQQGENNDNEDGSRISDSEAAFAWKHPILYSWHLRNYYSNKRKTIKNESKNETVKNKAAYKKKKEEYKFERLEALNKNSQKNGQRVENSKYLMIQGIISTLIASLSVILLVRAFVIDAKSDGNGIVTFFNKIIKNIINLRSVFNDADTPIKNFLLSLGSALLFIILIITLYLLIYILVRVILYLLFQFNEDENQIKKIARLVKVFVFGIILGAIRPLLFVPNFLKFIEEYLLEIKLEDIISEYYPEDDNESTDEEESEDEINDKTKKQEETVE